MRKHFISISGIGLIMLFLISCKKENSETDTPQKPNSSKLIINVNSWLDKQKEGLIVADTLKIEALKRSLDFDGLRLERYKSLENFIIIPISKEFKSQNNQNENVTNYLILVSNNQDNIEKGNIIQYISSDNQKIAPPNTFNKIFNYQDLDCSGQFTILSVADYFQYELKFEGGKIKSVTELKKKDKPKGGSGRVNGCIEWYEETWFVWWDGTATMIDEVYLFTTCDGDCAQAKLANGRSFATNCNDGVGGGIAYDVCVSSAISAFQSEVNGARISSQTKSIHISAIDEVTKNKNPKWTILTGGFGMWELISEEIGVIKLIDASQNKWAWKSLTHGQITMEGSPLPTTSIEHNQGVGTPSFTPETAEVSTILYAGMSLNFQVIYRLICNCPVLPVIGWFPPVPRNYRATSTFWNSKPE